jgi:DNA polymerase elongation subunit (family B)
MKNKYKGTDMYAAVKRITNSVYGVLSDATSYNKGFRLFDWRMGESICLAGRKVVTECSDIALDWCHNNGYEDACIKMGDTDGFGICIPSADSMEEALRAGWEMEKEINKNIPERTAEMFDMSPNDNEIEIECESYAEGVFIKGEQDGRSEIGVRKKYAQRLRWEK